MTEPPTYKIAEPGGFDAEAFAQIEDLNYTFLDLLCRSVAANADPPSSVMGLAPGLAGRLAVLRHGRRMSMARCRFALFDMRLRDETYWRAVRPRHFPDTFNAATWIDDASLRDEVGTFALSAALFARHLSSVNFYAARLTFGVSSAVAQALGDVQLSALTRAVVGSPGLLSCRFAQNPRFWPDLVKYAREGSRQQCRAAHLLGTQLMVAG